LAHGLNRSHDMIAALTKSSSKAPVTAWQTDASIPDVDLIVVPGGISYGEHLCRGAINRANFPVFTKMSDGIRA
jgi:phosphoribosylformylglycinamidine synthase subunit PurQ / glutaminase